MDNLQQLIENFKATEKSLVLLLQEKIIEQNKELCSLREIVKTNDSLRNDFLTENEALQEFKTNRTTLWRLINKQLLKKYKVGGSNRYRYQDLIACFSKPIKWN